MSARRARRCLPAVALGLLFAWSAELAGQPPAAREYDLLRQAAALESAGQYSAAEGILSRVLEGNPGSLPALLQIERVLLVQGRPDGLLPVTEAVLRADPTSALGHQVRIRALALLDRPHDVVGAAEAWIAATPTLEIPYREIAQILGPGDPAAATAILERGRDAVPRGDALALELGSAYGAAGRWADAAREWSRAMGPEARGLNAVERRLRVLHDGGARVLRELVPLLAESSEPARLRAATVLAIDAGMGRPAARLARRTADSMRDPEERRGFLTEVARRADGAGLPGVSYFAYDALEGLIEDEDAVRWAVRARLADLALVTGDTARAAELFRRMERAFDPGSPQRRDALSMRVVLAARDGDAQGARKALTGFRREFPDSPELDAAASEVAAAYLRTGDIAAATAVLDGVSGPNTLRVRALLALEAGDLERARTHLVRAVPGLRGHDATEAIALAGLLHRLSPAGGEIVAELVATVLPARRTLDDIAERARGLPSGERAAILDFAAERAEAVDQREEARALRRTLLEDHADAPEASGALLALARDLGGSPEGAPEARILLARLMVDYPRSALVPQARTELARLDLAGVAR